MVNLEKRSSEEEIMDDLSIGGPIIDQTLRELNTINKYLGGDSVTLSALKMIVRKNSMSRDKPIRIVDMGCGGGDMLMKISKWATRENLEVELIGIDANPHIIKYATEHCSDYKIEFRCEDVLEQVLDSNSIDIVISTLFLHHFDENQCLGLIEKWSLATRIGVIINDIHRHMIAYYSIKWLTSIFSKSGMVKNDAALSVKRAFRSNEIQKLLPTSDSYTSTINWCWAFRWKIVIYRINP